jgi:hypothetical protein
MKNSNALDESKGIVFFAFNTGNVDYVKIADASAKLATKNLGLPITLITDLNSNPKFDYDKIIRVDNNVKNFRPDSTNATWRNAGRANVYDHSPYDLTILLDCDYLALDNSLLKLLDQPYDYKLMHNSHGVNGPIHKKMWTQYSLPFVWATVVLFRKTDRAKEYFNLIKRVERNYKYYKTLFNGSGSYRNDYAFAIADIILNGYTVDEYKSIPWSMLALESNIQSIDIKGNFLTVKCKDSAYAIVKQDIHIMDKEYLQSQNFLELLERLCNE